MRTIFFCLFLVYCATITASPTGQTNNPGHFEEYSPQEPQRPNQNQGDRVYFNSGSRQRESNPQQSSHCRNENVRQTCERGSGTVWANTNQNVWDPDNKIQVRHSNSWKCEPCCQIPGDWSIPECPPDRQATGIDRVFSLTKLKIEIANKDDAGTRDKLKMKFTNAAGLTCETNDLSYFGNFARGGNKIEFDATIPSHQEALGDCARNFRPVFRSFCEVQIGVNGDDPYEIRKGFSFRLI